jgi:translation initiation factor 2A
VTWSPNSKDFGVVYGYMPARTIVFNSRGVVTHKFAIGPRNTILFSPYGRFVLVAGFGNLAGQLDIYDVERDYRKVCTIEATNASVCQWSPDERYILTATTSPRLRVDNGIRIWHIGGELVYNQDLQDLYLVMWRPGIPKPNFVEDPLNPRPSPHSSALTYLGSVKTPSRSAEAYRPPGARGQVTPLAFKREDEGGVAYVTNGGLTTGSGFGKTYKGLVPGAEATTSVEEGLSGSNRGVEENLSKAALKNKKKRESRKVKEAADKLAGLLLGSGAVLPETASGTSSAPQRDDLKAPNSNAVTANISDQPLSQQTQTYRNDSSSGQPLLVSHKSYDVSQTAVETTDLKLSSSSSGGSPQEKKIRALLKKLRAIDDLKMRLIDGEKLEGTQLKKMDTENNVRRDLEALGWHD